MATPIIDRLEGFSQVCVWPGIVICGQGKEPSAEDIETFTQFFADEFGVRVQYLEQVTTLPDLTLLGNPIPETGGRNDILFAVHLDDIERFVTKRFAIGARWIEDVLAVHNHGRHMYDCDRLDRYKTW